MATARRKAPDERRSEILGAASAIALADGLDRVTARRLADSLGVVPGLITHYFPSADLLVAAAFEAAAASERDQLFGHAEEAPKAVDRIDRLLDSWLDPERDAVSLLWLDAWQTSRRRPALLTSVTEQMGIEQDRLEALLRSGIESSEFNIADPRAAAMQILSLVDGMSVQAAIRTTVDYGPVREMVVGVVEKVLGLPRSSLDRSESK